MGFRQMAKRHNEPYRLFKRGDIYHAYISFISETKGRIVIRESTGTSDETKAIRYCLNRISEIEQSEKTKVSGELPCITLDEAFSRYYLERGQFHTRPEAVLKRLYNIKKILHIDYLHQLDKAVLSDFVANRRMNVKNGTINRELAILSAVRNLAADFWEVKINRANPQKFKLPIPAPQINYLPDWASAERIIKQAPSHLKPIIYTAIYSGLRRGNILSLRWDNIDFVNDVIKVKVKDKNTVGGKIHTTPLLPELKNILLQQPKINDYIFNYDGHPIKDIKHAWRSIFFNPDGSSKGIPYIRFHDLRHTYITWIVRNTGNIALAQKAVGHSSSKVTEFYTHLTASDTAAALRDVFKKITS